METAFQTDRGKVRKHNEDCGGLFANQSDWLLAVVADGMGGHRAGDVASQLALDYLRDSWQTASHVRTVDEAEQWLQDHIKGANAAILAYAVNHPACTGMGTTIVAALCCESHVVVAHVGDSRGYMLRHNQLIQITTDHSLVNELLQKGEITEAEAEVHPKKHIVLQALGIHEEVMPDTTVYPWQDHHKLLLCSDGLTDTVSDQRLGDILRSNDTAENEARRLIADANALGGIDNITLTLIRRQTEDQITSQKTSESRVSAEAKGTTALSREGD